MKKVILKPGKDEPIRRFHPWVFSGAVSKTDGNPVDGDIVEVHNINGEFLATGHFHFGTIAVKIFSFQQTTPDQLFWEQKIMAALKYRQQLHLSSNINTDCFRLVHGEGDGMPGLIVDVYGQVAVIQCHSIGMHKVRVSLANALMNCLDNQITAVYDKSKETLPVQYSQSVANTYLIGNAEPAFVHENGLKFLVDWTAGQKTGFFLDQRDNRRILFEFTAGKTVLNAFSYSGGFSVYALKAGASLVHSVDVSQKAMEWCEINVRENVNNKENHTGHSGDVMEFLKSATTYDIVVIDPPAFAKSFQKRHNAVQGYKRLNAAALEKVNPGGFLFTFSCSQVVDRELFYNTVVAAAIEAKRNVRVVRHLSQAPDHPVSLFHPEGSYLKGLILYVE